MAWKIVAQISNQYCRQQIVRVVVYQEEGHLNRMVDKGQTQNMIICIGNLVNWKPLSPKRIICQG